VSDTSYAKLGGFAIVGALAIAAALTTVGYRSLTEPSEDYTVYFAESVQGLSLGSAVKFRGVIVGNVSKIAVAADGRHVRVEAALFDRAVRRIHLGREEPEGKELCAQLSPVGLTGTKIVQMDMFSAEDCVEADTLPFAVADKTIPVTRSTLENVEVAVRKLAKATPQVARDLSELVQRINALVGDVEGEGDPTTVADTISQLNETFSTINDKLEQFDTPGMSRDVRGTLRQVKHTTATVDELLVRLERQRGLIGRMERASSAVGDLAIGFDRNSGDVESALRDISEAAQAVRRLADTLERDPDMLLKGRAELKR
jgi:paraquat-inducible protein B